MADATPDPAPAFARALAHLNASDRVGLAVSGGSDSMALLGLARDWALTLGASLTVATVDHGLRPESRDEARTVADRCATWQIPHQTLVLAGLDTGGNLAARAREARYDALSDWAQEVGAAPVLLGHTMDDQAETVLMRLARGSGVEGLSGMADGMTWNGVRFSRPLLGLRRADLRDWLRACEIDWIDDPSNEDRAYDRVKARHALAVLEPLGISVDGLSATADRLARQRHVLEAAAEDLAAHALTRADTGATLQRDALRSALPDTAMRLLATTLMEIGGNPYRPRFRSLEPLFQRILSDEQTTATLAGCLIKLTRFEIVIRPEHAA